MLATALKGALAHKSRLVNTGLAVVLGVAFLAGTLVLTDTVSATLDDLYAGAHPGTDVYVRSEAAFDSYIGPQRPRLDSGLVGLVAAVDGVSAAEGVVEGYATLVPDAERTRGASRGAGLGRAWSNVEELNPFRIVAGRPPRSAGEIVVDPASAATGGYSVGDQARVVVQGGLQRMQVVGMAAFGRADSRGGDAYVFFTSADAERLVGVPGRLDGIAVAGEPGLSARQLRDRIAAAVPARTEVLTGAEVVAEEQARAGRGITQAVRSFLLAFVLIAMFVAAFMINNTFTILIAQRTKEVALLRAVGASRRQVVGSVLVEAVVVGAVASAVGVAAGAAVALMLRSLMSAFGFALPAGPLVITPGAVLLPLLVGIAVTVASAVLPARRASRVPPVAALREVATDSCGRSVGRIFTGVVLAVAGGLGLLVGLTTDGLAVAGAGAALVFLGVAALGPVFARPLTLLLGLPLAALRGVPGSLARQNAARNPRRTSAASAALMIGVGLVSFLSIFATSAKASLQREGKAAAQATPGAEGPASTGPDFMIESGAHGRGGLSPELSRRLAQLPEVAAVASLGMGIAQVAGDASRDLVAMDPAAYAPVSGMNGSDRTVEGSLAGLGDNDIAVAEDVARTRNWSLGQRLPVVFADSGQREFRVVAFYRGLPGSYLVSLETFEANVALPFDEHVLVKKAPAVDAAAARRAVEAVTADYGVNELRTAGPGGDPQVDQMLNMVYVLLALAVLIALVGITNTLSLSILERTRELGLLRAVGMSRNELRSMVRWEAVLIALLGTLLGLVLGLFFAWMMAAAVPAGFEVSLHIPFRRLGVVVAIAAAAALLSAMAPARRAARLDVLAAVSHP